MDKYNKLDPTGKPTRMKQLELSSIPPICSKTRSVNESATHVKSRSTVTSATTTCTTTSTASRSYSSKASSQQPRPASAPRRSAGPSPARRDSEARRSYDRYQTSGWSRELSNLHVREGYDAESGPKALHSTKPTEATTIARNYKARRSWDNQVNMVAPSPERAQESDVDATPPVRKPRPKALQLSHSTSSPSPNPSPGNTSTPGSESLEECMQVRGSHESMSPVEVARQRRASARALPAEYGPSHARQRGRHRQQTRPPPEPVQVAVDSNGIPLWKAKLYGLKSAKRVMRTGLSKAHGSARHSSFDAPTFASASKEVRNQGKSLQPPRSPAQREEALVAGVGSESPRLEPMLAHCRRAPAHADGPTSHSNPVFVHDPLADPALEMESAGRNDPYAKRSFNPTYETSTGEEAMTPLSLAKSGVVEPASYPAPSKSHPNPAEAMLPSNRQRLRAGLAATLLRCCAVSGVAYWLLMEVVSPKLVAGPSRNTPHVDPSGTLAEQITNANGADAAMYDALDLAQVIKPLQGAAAYVATTLVLAEKYFASSMASLAQRVSAYDATSVLGDIQWHKIGAARFFSAEQLATVSELMPTGSESKAGVLGVMGGALLGALIFSFRSPKSKQSAHALADGRAFPSHSPHADGLSQEVSSSAQCTPLEFGTDEQHEWNPRHEEDPAPLQTDELSADSLNFAAAPMPRVHTPSKRLPFMEPIQEEESPRSLPGQRRPDSKHRKHSAMTGKIQGTIFQKATKLYRMDMQIRNKNIDYNALKLDILNVLMVLDRALAECKGKSWEAEGIRMFRFDMDEVKRNLGTYSPDVAGLFSNLAVILMHVKSHPESELMFKRAIGIFKKINGVESEEVADVLEGLRQLAMKQGKHQVAHSINARILRIREKLLGSTHPVVAGAVYVQAGLDCALARYTASATQYLRAVRIWELHNEESEKLADALGKLGCLHNYMGCYSDAEECHHKALAMNEEIYGLYHPEVVISHYSLAAAKCHLAKYEECMILYHNGLLVEQSLDSSTAHVVDARCDLIEMLKEHGMLS